MHWAEEVKIFRGKYAKSIKKDLNKQRHDHVKRKESRWQIEIPPNISTYFMYGCHIVKGFGAVVLSVPYPVCVRFSWVSFW